MKKFPLLIVLICLSGKLFSQKIDSKDSLLILKFWDKIQISSITSQSGNLYVGINNYLELKFPKGETLPYRLFLKTNNGTLDLVTNKFVIVPKYIGNSYIRIYIINDHNDTLLIGRKKLIVLGIPDPCLILGHTIIHENSIVNRNIFLKGDSLKLFFTEDLTESKKWYNIDYFDSGYTYGGGYFYEDNKGSVFSNEAVESIKKLHSGQELVIKIIAVSPRAQHFRIMPIVRFRML
jgi:hypothetical protein